MDTKMNGRRIKYMARRSQLDVGGNPESVEEVEIAHRPPSLGDPPQRLMNSGL